VIGTGANVVTFTDGTGVGLPVAVGFELVGADADFDPDAVVVGDALAATDDVAVPLAEALLDLPWEQAEASRIAGTTAETASARRRVGAVNKITISLDWAIQRLDRR
jgi:hypothetical protein